MTNNKEIYNRDNEQLFKLIFNNIVLFKLIYKFVWLYKKNEIVEFKTRKDLIEYEEREYIQSLVYDSKEMLEIGDLPIGGSLKKVRLIAMELISVKGNTIPDGVEVLDFQWYHYHKLARYCMEPLSTFPSTIHTIKNVSLAFKSINSTEHTIPPNITSISFIKCPNISGNNQDGKNYIIIPNTIKSISFTWWWDNNKIPLKKGDLPKGLTNCIIPYDFNQILTKGIIPNTIKNLTLPISEEYKINGQFKFDSIFSKKLLSNIETLDIMSTKLIIKPDSNFSLFKTLTKLTCSFNSNSEIRPNVIPLTVTYLRLIDVSFEIKKDILPSSLIKLSLHLNYTNLLTKDSLPSSLLYLNFENGCKFKLENSHSDILPPKLECLSINSQYTLIYQVLDFIPILPSTVLTIVLPFHFKEIITTEIENILNIKNIKFQNKPTNFCCPDC